MMTNAFGFGQPRYRSANVHHQSFCERMVAESFYARLVYLTNRLLVLQGNAICGAVFGFILFFVMLIVVFWNEGRSVKTMQAIDEVTDAALITDCGQVTDEYLDKAVHISCSVTNLANFSSSSR